MNGHRHPGNEPLQTQTRLINQQSQKTFITHPTMFKSLVLVAAAIAPVLVRADFCKATDDVLFFSW